MHPMIFMAYNLKAGQKVSLTMPAKSKDDKYKHVELFFCGYTNKFGLKTASHTSMLRPVFAVPTKSNTPGRKTEPIGFEDIEDLSIIDSPDDVQLMPNEVDGWMIARAIMSRTALVEVYAICREMNSLFKGKRIPLNTSVDAARTNDNGDGITKCSVTSLGVNECGTPTFDLCDTETGAKSTVTMEQIDVDGTVLLSELIESIQNPEFYEEFSEKAAKDNPLLLLSWMQWDEIPKASQNEKALEKLGLLEILRVNLWWRTLSLEEKTELLSENYFIDKSIKKSKNMEEDINVMWEKEFTSGRKSFCFHSWILKNNKES